MQKRKKTIALLAALFTMAGCSNSELGCSDKKVLDSLTQLQVEAAIKDTAAYVAKMREKKETPENLAAYEVYAAKSIAATKNAKFTNIKTNAADEKTGTYSCAATIEITDAGKTEKRDFTYVLEKPKDEKNLKVSSTKGLLI